MEDDSRQISDILNKRVEADFKKLDTEAKETIRQRLADLETYEREKRAEMERSLRELGERLTRDTRTQIFSIALGVVSVAAGAMLFGSFASTREVNSSVIALQKDIISAQTTIKASNDALAEQKSKVDSTLKVTNDALIDQRSKLADAQTTLKTTTDELAAARQHLEKTNTDLEKARVEYENLSKAITNIPQPAETH